MKIELQIFIKAKNLKELTYEHKCIGFHKTGPKNKFNQTYEGRFRTKTVIKSQRKLEKIKRERCKILEINQN